jgi:hypothetical protein
VLDAYAASTAKFQVPSPEPTRSGIPTLVSRAVARTRSPSARHAAAGPTGPTGRYQPEAPAALRILASLVQLRHPGADPVGDLDAHHLVPDPDRDRDRLAGSARPAVPETVAEEPTSSAASSPHGCPSPSTAPTNVRATRARSANPARVTVSRTAAPVISTPPSRPPSSREPRGNARAGRGMHARLGGARQAGKPRQRGPSVAVREKADGAHRPSWRHGRPSAIRPRPPQHSGPQCYEMTHGGTKQNGPHSRVDAASGAVFAGGGRWWIRTTEGVADGFTARPSCPSLPPLTGAYALRGAIAGRRRPLCVRAYRARGRQNSRTGTDGEGRSGVQTVRRSGTPTVLC